MRLINTKTLEVEEFFDIHVPNYAILSHTWSDGEVSLQEWADRKNRRFKPGFQKIMWACTEAAKDGLDYVWVDTNCIDKTSSAELSEAINSMFRWYRRSHICYAYLEDVPLVSVEECIETGSLFRQAKWFTRGWTLQELIAPPDLKFFSKDWQEIGTKADLALCISEVTGVAWTCLLKRKLSKSHPLRGYSVAQRLSWASRRSTTRIEDQAYSLLGLFDITMPLVYGEGYEAFTRFLGEIIRKYADHSFFASQLRYVDFLPRSPMEFCDSQSVVIGNSPQLQKHYTPVYHSYPFQLTNTGLQITLPIVTTLAPHFAFGVLDCWDFESGSTQATRSISRIWIPLIQKGPPGLQQYSRLLWPQVFFAVKLVRKHSIMRLAHQSEQLIDGALDGSFTMTPAPEPASILNVVQHVDLVSTDSHKSILIKKPYATTISVPPWQPREAGSPFLLCFPRGTADYRLYEIFPQGDRPDATWSAETPPLLPLVMPRRIHRTKSKASDVKASNKEPVQERLYGVVIVFKKRQSRPAKFVAMCLANLPRTNDVGTKTFRPACKIIRDWTPLKAQGLHTIDFDTLADLDADGDVLITIQKVSCSIRTTARGMEPRFVGLTQVVFDRFQMMDELDLSQNANKKPPEGVLQYFGLECSDEEVGNLI